jgi:hypothetical protein
VLSVVLVLWTGFIKTHLGTQQVLEMPEIRKLFSDLRSPCVVCSVTVMAPSSVIERMVVIYQPSELEAPDPS